MQSYPVETDRDHDRTENRINEKAEIKRDRDFGRSLVHSKNYMRKVNSKNYTRKVRNIGVGFFPGKNCSLKDKILVRSTELDPPHLNKNVLIIS